MIFLSLVIQHYTHANNSYDVKDYSKHYQSNTYFDKRIGCIYRLSCSDKISS